MNITQFLIDFTFLLVLFTLVIYFVNKIKTKYFGKSKILYLSLLYHTLFSFIFYFIFFHSSDAFGYFASAKFGFSYGIGTDFVIFLLYPFANWLGISALSCFILFGIFGFFGLTFFYISIKENLKLNKIPKFLPFLLFIPGLNFWSSAIGKDSLIFLGFGLLLFSLSKLNRRYLWLGFSLLLIFCVRPHVFFIAVISILLAFLFGKYNISLHKKLTLLLILVLVLIFTYKPVISYTGLYDEEYLQDYIGKRQILNLGGGSSISVSNNPFIAVFSFLFRPLFLDAHNLSALFASFENLLYLILAITLISPMFISFLVKEKSIYLRFNEFFFIGFTLIFSLTISNLGLAVRQKIIVMASFLVIFVIYQSKQSLKKKKTSIK